MYIVSIVYPIRTVQVVPLAYPTRRYLPSIVRQVVAELNQAVGAFHYTCHVQNDGWVIEISQLAEAMVTKRLRIFGYHFSLNEASVAYICTDKAACANLLLSHDVPCVPHVLFTRPSIAEYVPEKGVFQPLFQQAEQFGYPLVAKINDGTGGNGVFYISTPRMLEVIASSIFSKSRDLCLSPYYEILEEYRLIVLDGAVQICFSKQRPRLVGDGQQTVLELLAAFDREHKKGLALHEFDAHSFSKKLAEVLQPGEVLYLNWKHNLSLGSIPVLVAPDDILYALACQAASATGLRFGSVDIIHTKAHGHQVLELNAGLMMENFIAHYHEANWGYNKALEIYKKAIISYFVGS